MKDIYAEVTDRIIKQLEQGVIPWQKPWIASGAAISHHHGIGKMFAPWLEGYIGRREYEVFRVLKNHFDPDYMMNPGGTIGLDLPESEKKFLCDRGE